MQKIAIVDDAPDNRDFLYYLLRDDYAVRVYDSGEEALKQFLLDPPDLVILDVWLGGIDGTEVLKRIRENAALLHVPVVDLTANVTASSREKYLAAGFDEYVSKPIREIDTFVATLHKLLSHSEPK